MGSGKSAFRPTAAIVMLAVAVLTLPGASRGNAPISRAASWRASAAPTLANLGLGFEPNVGQTDARVQYLARGSGYTLFLTQTEAVLALSEPARDSRPSSDSVAASSKPTSGSTLLGGKGVDFGGPIAVDSRGFAYVSGEYQGSDFPTTKGAYETLISQGISPDLLEAAVLTVINPGSNQKLPALVYSTYLAGFGVLPGWGGIAIDSSRIAWLAGGGYVPLTSSADALQDADGRASVVAFDPSQVLPAVSVPLTVSLNSLQFQASATTNASRTVTLAYPSSGIRSSSSLLPIVIEGVGVTSGTSAPNPGFQIVNSATTCAVGLSLSPGDSCTVTVAFSPPSAGAGSGGGFAKTSGGLLTIGDTAKNSPQQIDLVISGAPGPPQVR
jgi:hypothetical protein